MSTFYPNATISEVNTRLNVRRLMQAIDYRFDKFQENPRGAKGFCPIHREGLFRNLVIDKDTHTFRCQYTQCVGSQGGSLVDLYAQAKGLNVDDAVREIVRDQTLDIDLPVNEELIQLDVEKVDNLLATGQQDQAEADYLRILEIHPQNVSAHLGLLKIYQERGLEEQRRNKLATVCRLKIAAGQAADIPELIQEWSELESDSPDARFACAELLHSRGDTESAIMEFMGAGDACEGTGDLEAALHVYRRAADLSIEHQIDVIDVTPHVVRVLSDLGRTDEAVDHLLSIGEKAATRDDANTAVEHFIMALEVDSSRLDAHRRFLETVMAIPPTPVIAHHVVQSAQYLRDQEEHDYGMQALENFLAIAPNNESALHALINEYNNHGRAQDALDLEARLARVVYDDGRVEEAREIVDRVLTWQPQHVPMLETMIYFQDKENLTEESRESRKRMIRALTTQKKFAESLTVITDLIDSAGEADDLLDLKASALEGLGRGGDQASRESAVITLEHLADKHLEATSGRRALMYLQRAADLQQSPSSELYFKIARAHLRNKDYPQVRDSVISACENLASHDRLDEAILEAERYSNLIPDDTDLVRYLVELYLRFDDKAAAVDRMRRLAQDLTRLDREAEAEEVLEQANDLEPQTLETLQRQLDQYRQSGNKDRIQQALLKLAGLQEQQTAWPDAIKLLEEYLAEAPDDKNVMTRLIGVYDKLELVDEARQWRLQLARSYRTANDSDRESRTLRDILSRFPDDEEALHMLMNAEFNRGDMQAGVTIARRLTTFQINSGKVETARKTLLKAVERVPENLDLNRDIYELHYQNKQPNQALTWGRKVINILRSSSKNGEAAIVFDQLVELDPANLPLKQDQLKFLEETGRDAEVVEKRIGLASLYRTQERFRDAEAMLHAVLKVDNRNLEAMGMLADLFMHLGEDTKAENQLVRMAGIYHLEGDNPKAIEILKQVLVANTANAEARRQLSQVYRSEGNTSAAINELLELADSYRRSSMEIEAMASEREAMDLDPANAEVRRRVIDSLKAAGRISQAAEELEQLARQHLDAQDFPLAMEALDEVVEMDPSRLSTRKIRADVLVKLGKTQEAMEELQKLADIALAGGGKAAAESTSAPDEPSRVPLQLVKEYTFETFVVGANNDFAYATALAIARSPARAYNPLFLYANVGLGKTHLCNAIANYLLEHDPRAQIIYTNSEDFTDELVEAIQNNAVQQFRTRYRSLDLLIVDDVQFLTGKERAQEEFFHIFNSLFQAKRQIVITSDRPPAEIAHLESRLRSRFGAGVIVDIASPDLETRLAILNREVEESKAAVDAWITRLLSERIDSNVRDLKSALNQVTAMRDLRKQALTQDNISKMLDTLYPPAAV